ncbi:hypothetical protein OPT61_g867 [Boeremia exigua]|uniref:Uncharacterized protein n=1 Tax=Boeremia exigua TaxID=749465 RepID=A0ACC2IS97_9PLEO|nr:hypothetical protein OPT61_g867 [Boeremia exigua]
MSHFRSCRPPGSNIMSIAVARWRRSVGAAVRDPEGSGKIRAKRATQSGKQEVFAYNGKRTLREARTTGGPTTQWKAAAFDHPVQLKASPRRLTDVLAGPGAHKCQRKGKAASMNESCSFTSDARCRIAGEHDAAAAFPPGLRIAVAASTTSRSATGLPSSKFDAFATAPQT